MVIQFAKNFEDAQIQLGNLGLKVGPRTGQNKRSNQDEELWCLRKLLEVLAENSKILWPISIVHTDSPDFIITENNYEYGLEITRAVSEEDERELTLAERASIGVYSIGDFRGRKSADDLSAATEIAYNIANAIQRKYKKTYLLQRPTDLFIYVKGNNVIWLDGSNTDDDGLLYKHLVCNFEYPNMENFRNIMLFWDSGELYFIKECQNKFNVSNKNTSETLA